MADNQIGYQYRNDAAVFLFDNKGFFFFYLVVIYCPASKFEYKCKLWVYFQYQYNDLGNLKLYFRTFNWYLHVWWWKKSSLK